MNMKAHPRGQGTAEAALGAFIFVTVLIFGVHFAEVGYIALKVQEAENSAVWDATSQPMHDTFAHDWTPYQTAITFAQNATNDRYRDFDALKDGPTTLTQVFTRATNLNVACRPLAVTDRVAPLGPVAAAAAAYPTGISGLACQTQAAVEGFRVPEVFLDGSLSSVRHYSRTSFQVKAIGPLSNAVPSTLGMLLDDWGYSGQLEAQECPLAWEGGTTCANQGYYDQVNAVYGAGGGGSAGALATFVSGGSPIAEGHFYMSFRGRESPLGPYVETVRRSHGDVKWETTPFRAVGAGYNAPRTNCWLGEVCL